MKFILYRSSLSLTSGAGQLIRIQAEALRAVGQEAVVACRTGWLRFRWKTGLPARPAASWRLARWGDRERSYLVDHGMELCDANLVFVHNLMTEAVRHLPRKDWLEQAQREREFLAA